ncbi:glyoxylate/hydroxypyruvate reductase A [Nereida sp. MMG025]|uniref:2-hydroxyacid dehydrogenase n=1 Tax=Nereida sp. MMG025 TaxID=2909981 RepID=UPI001F441762|nr:glyoxylate/hydroxypyruvate reductase A [Nereida sp. MMG025]MCF6444176.1 glyoxylate/hydroxypyruvate reductase A [Nereida sp. MMG025]
MTLNILFAATDARWDEYKDVLPQAFAHAGLKTELSRNHAPDQTDYIVYAPNSPLQDFTPYTRAKAVLNLWAGVEEVTHNQSLTIPLVRMVDHGLTQGMVEWVTGHTLRHHLGMDAHILGQDGQWRSTVPPLAEDRRVTILGLGTLGTACAQALCALGFPVTGWSRSQKHIHGIRCLAGGDGLREALSSADIVILLVPQTTATMNLLNDDRIALLPKGAIVINPARGPVIDDDALLGALDSGHLAHATLDVFRTEPLPPAHRFWTHPQVTVTPHIASVTRPKTAAAAIAANIARNEAGNDMIGVVDRGAGY